VKYQFAHTTQAQSKHNLDIMKCQGAWWASWTSAE
jgi:hypothetical protein